MNTYFLRLFSIMILCWCGVVNAGAPLWTFTPLTATTISVPTNTMATVQYIVTNQSHNTHTLNMQSIPGITQTTTGLGICGNPFVLTGNASCTLTLQIDGSALTRAISDGPIVCQQGSTLQCYRPSSANVLHITQVPATAMATISVTGSPLTMTTNGPYGFLTINNTSLLVTATNITSNFVGTALDGNVTEVGNTCASVAPLGSCILTYSAGSTIVSQTDFTIQGSNTNMATAAIQIDAGVTLTNITPSSGSASGGTGVTLTGTVLTGTTGVTFDGVAATSVAVINSTTVTAVTPAHAAGVVDVVIITSAGSAIDISGYTYLTTAVGQAAYGGIVACLNGGVNNLIAATADNSTGIVWGGLGTTTNASSVTDGSVNTTTIVTALGGNGGVPYAAQLCQEYEADSQGNTPCETGNTCYDDWFLPAGGNTGASGQLNCLYTNQASIGGFSSGFYWSSSEVNASLAWGQNFNTGSQNIVNKNNSINTRCVRAFSP